LVPFFLLELPLLQPPPGLVCVSATVRQSHKFVTHAMHASSVVALALLVVLPRPRHRLNSNHRFELLTEFCFLNIYKHALQLLGPLNSIFVPGLEIECEIGWVFREIEH
jgi:hypothetical protein